MYLMTSIFHHEITSYVYAMEHNHTEAIDREASYSLQLHVSRHQFSTQNVTRKPVT